jgi:hypothetical protein
MALVRTYVSEEYITSIIGVKRIGELRTTLAIISIRSTLQYIFGCLLMLTLLLTRRFLSPDDGGDMILRNVVTSQATALFIATAVETSNFT